MSPDSITLGIAVWGAILGTVSFVWNIYRSISDKGRLRVSCKIARFAVIPASVVPPGDRPTEPQLAFTITNVGRRAIFVSRIGGIYKNGKPFEVVPHTALPKELKPGENISERAEDPVRTLLSNGGAKSLGAWDTTGKLYAVPRHEVQRLKIEAARLRDGGSASA